jgi:hypothetical protein
MKQLLLILALLWTLPALAQTPQQTALGFCNIGSVASNTAITSSNCVFGSFTGAITGNVLTTSAVSAYILVGQPIVGTNVPANTYVTAKRSGGGLNTAGTYTLNNSVSSPITAESMTTAGIPFFAKYALVCAQTQAVNWLASGQTPSSAVGGGNLLPAGSCMGFNATTGASTTFPGGDLSLLQFVQQAASAVVTVDFYQ